MEKYFFINHIVFGKLYFFIIFAIFVIVLLTFIILFFRYKKDFYTIKEHFLTAVLIIWLGFTLILVSVEINWLVVDYPSLINKSQIDKVGFIYNKFADDDELIPYLKFVKNNIENGSTAYFVSPPGSAHIFARYYLYPEIKLINSGMPDYILLYDGDPANFNANKPLEIYKSFTPYKNILKIKI
ncbi:MAG: hypothetical protein Q8O59_04425, partial [bacterium]|nr:hypothetical protein [bacterium]